MRILKCTPEDRDHIENALDASNEKAEPGMSKLLDHSFVMKDDDDNFVAGIISTIYFQKALYIDALVVDENARGAGYGAKLLKFAEERAKKAGVCLIHLETSDFQAKGFYEKMGYTVFAELPLPLNHRLYYMKRELD